MSVRWKNRPPGSNWGDFGTDDQIGRMNLLTTECRLRACREVSVGLTFTLTLPLDYPGGSILSPYRKPPEFNVVPRGSGHNYNYSLAEVNPAFTDVISDDAVLLFTQYSTQWDSLAHAGQAFDADDDGVAESVYYNGFRAGKDIVGPGEAGPFAKALGIENLAVAGVQGRGVLVDLHAIYGRERVLTGYDELMAALERGKAAVEPGDFLCLRTGFAEVLLEMKRKPDRELLMRSCAALDGRDQRLLQWITDSGIVAICADNFAVEAYPARNSASDRHPALPLHEHCLFKLGVHLGELWYFAELAEWLAANRRSSFLLTAPPLRLPGAVGSPVTPIATV
jgi:kynurenine formamidase